MQAAAGFDFDAGNLVPAAQLIERDAEAIRDGDQRIAPAHGVEPGVRGGRGGRRHRNHQRLDAREAVARAAAGWPRPVPPPVTRYSRATEASVSSGGHGVVAPGVALGFGDQGDALLEERGRAGRQVQIERRCRAA